MKTVCIFAILFIFLGCQQSNQNNIQSSTTDSLFQENSRKSNWTYPTEGVYTNIAKPDTMHLIVGNDSMLVTSLGKVYRNGSLWIDIKAETPIRKLYVYPTDNDFVVFYEYTDGDEGGSSAKRISKENKILWTSPIYSFNLSVPVIQADFAYLSTAAFLGKLNLKDGKYSWKHELNLKFEVFEEPILLNDSTILFTQNANSMITDSVLVNDRSGMILKIN